MLTIDSRRERMQREDQARRQMVAAPVRLFRTESGAIVGEDHPERRWVHCGAGQMVPRADVQAALGDTVDLAGPAEAQSGIESKEQAVENKAEKRTKGENLAGSNGAGRRRSGPRAGRK